MKKIIDYLTLEEKEYLHIKTYEKKMLIFKENEKCEYLSIILNGEAIIVSYLIDGKEIIYKNLSENMLFGNNLIFSTKPYYKGDVIALSKVTIAHINKENLIKILKENEEFLIHYLNIQSDSIKDSNDQIKILVQNKAIDRLYYYLNINNNKIAYKSINELSKKLNLSRESLSRLINKLVKEKKLLKNKNKIELI